MKMKKRYNLNKSLKVGDNCICPSCGTEFVKKYYQQAFCQTKKGTICKDKYWNTVTPEKRNNTTRISPKNAEWMKRKRIENEIRDRDYDPEDYFHPQDPYSLGQD